MPTGAVLKLKRVVYLAATTDTVESKKDFPITDLKAN